MSNVIPIKCDGASGTIPECRVSLDELERLFGSIFMDCDQRDDRLYVTDGLDTVCSVMINSDMKSLQFATMLEHKGPTAEKVINKVNELNGDLVMVRFHQFDENSLWADYFMTYEDGINQRQLVKQLRRFAKICAAVECDVFGKPVE